MHVRSLLLMDLPIIFFVTLQEKTENLESNIVIVLDHISQVIFLSYQEDKNYIILIESFTI